MDTHAKQEIYSYEMILFLCFVIFTVVGCGGSGGDGDGDGAQNIGWVTIIEPSNLDTFIVNDVSSIDLAGEFFESPSAGWKTSWRCRCAGFSCLFGNPGCEEVTFYSYAVTVTITNITTGDSATGTLSLTNYWLASIPLIYDQNVIEVHVEDANENWATKQIIIDVQDTIPPTILSRSPENNAINVATTTDITLTFSEPMASSSITPSTINLSVNGSEIEGAITFDDVANKLVFSPRYPLLYNTSYIVSINSDVTDINGTRLTADTWQFTTIPMASIPVVQTEEVTEIGETSAMLWGSVNPNYADTEVWFEWGTDGNLNIFSATEKIDIPQLSGDSKLSSIITLNPGMDYYYRIVASNSAGATKGDIQSFFTLAPPTVISSPPLLLSPYQVKLSGSVNPNGYVTESSFNISPRPDIASHISSSPAMQLGDGRNFIDVDHQFDQLASGTKYYFRHEASYPRGTVSNDVLSFVTPYSTSSCWAKRYHPFKDYYQLSLPEEITSIDQTLDDGYIFIERHFSESGGSGYPERIIKTNSDGGVEWAHGYCQSPSIFCPHISAVRQISTGGYLVTGFKTVAYSSTFSEDNSWIAELDENGDTVWAKAYGTSIPFNGSRDISHHPVDIQLLADGYIVSGTFNGSSTWMMKLDKTGKLIWSRSYPWGVNAVAQVPGGYVMVSTTGYYYTQDRDMMVLMLDQDGMVQWANDYGTTDKDIAKSMAVSSGTIAIAGTVTYVDNTTDVRVIGINNSGDITWQYTFDGGYNDSASTIRVASDGGFIIGVNTDINESDKGVVLLKLSNSGILEWQKLYPDKIIAYDQNILSPVSGGDYIIGVRSTPSQVNSFELIKTDSSGSCSPLDTSSSMVPTVSQLTLAPSTASSGNGSPTEELAINIDAFDWYVEIEQIYP